MAHSEFTIDCALSRCLRRIRGIAVGLAVFCGALLLLISSLLVRSRLEWEGRQWIHLHQSAIQAALYLNNTYGLNHHLRSPSGSMSNFLRIEPQVSERPYAEPNRSWYLFSVFDSPRAVVSDELTYGGSHQGYLIVATRLKPGLWIFVWCAVLFISIAILVTISAFVRSFHLSVSSILVKPLNALREHIRNAYMQDIAHNPEGLNSPKEINQLKSDYDTLMQQIRKDNEAILAREKALAIEAVARQVAHDIRSPLAALSAISEGLKALPEDSRILVRSAVSRICDIANNLLAKTAEADAVRTKGGTVTTQHAPQLISSLLESILSEKRAQFRSRLGIALDFALTLQNYGLFAVIDPVEFKRVISNLINNAVEAIDNTGSIVVNLSTTSPDDSRTIVIQIIDNGRGIPSDLLEQLGKWGATFGKTGGSGLGIFHARNTVTGWGGRLLIESEVGRGSRVNICLPQSPPPEWFLHELMIPSNGLVIVLDDDPSIHQVWNRRLQSAGVCKTNIIHFSRSADLVSWFEAEKALPNSCVYLLDYELIGDDRNGLDMAEALGICSESVLVSSRYEESRVRARCEQLGIKLVPKIMAGFVPVRFSLPEKRLDAILIDDDPLVQATWRWCAQLHGKYCLIFSKAVDFIDSATAISRATPIFIDSQLENGVQGEKEAEKLFALGFQNLFLATGRQPSELGTIPIFKGIVGKSPPWQ